MQVIRVICFGLRYKTRIKNKERTAIQMQLPLITGFAAVLKTKAEREKQRETKTGLLSSSTHSGADVLWPQLLSQSGRHRLVLLGRVGTLTHTTVTH